MLSKNRVVHIQEVLAKSRENAQQYMVIIIIYLTLLINSV